MYVSCATTSNGLVRGRGSGQDTGFKRMGGEVLPAAPGRAAVNTVLRYSILHLLHLASSKLKKLQLVLEGDVSRQWLEN